MSQSSEFDEHLPNTILSKMCKLWILTSTILDGTPSPKTSRINEFLPINPELPPERLKALLILLRSASFTAGHEMRIYKVALTIRI